MSEVVTLRAGERVWFDGSSWEIVAVHGRDVTLRDGEALQRVGVAELAARGSTMGGGDAAPSRDPAAVVLSSLSAAQRQELEARADHVRSVLSAVENDTVLLKTVLAAKADELGVSVRTLQRWIADYRGSGVVGLVDSRVRSRDADAVDPRWDAACLRVLDRYVDASTPTRRAVLDKVARELEVSFGPGVVPLPSTSTAYRRLKELAKGRHAFGSGEGAPVGGRAAHGCAGSAAARSPRGVRGAGYHSVGRVRDGAGHDALGRGGTDGGDGSVQPLRARSAAHPGVDEGAGRGERALPVRHPEPGSRRHRSLAVSRGAPQRAGRYRGARWDLAAPRR